MPGLPALNEDCLKEIVYQTSSSTLPNLCLTNRVFNRLATPQLYNYIYYWVPGGRGYLFPLPETSKFPQSAEKWSRIYSLPLLMRTLENSLPLVLSIISISLDLGNILNFDPTKTTVRFVSDLLRVIPPSVYLHFADDYPIYSGWPIFGTMTSKDSTLPLRYYRSRDYPGFSNLFTLRNAPQLTQLTLFGVQPLEWRHNPIMGISAPPGRSHTVTHLTITNGVPMDTTFEKLLTWPRALELLHHDGWRSQVAERDRWYYGQSIYDFSLIRFINTLSIHADSLQELYISPEDQNFTFNEKIGTSLLSLWNLRRLGLPRNFFFFTESERTSGKFEECHTIWKCLPPALQVLQLQLDNQFCSYIKPESTTGETSISQLAKRGRPTLGDLEMQEWCLIDHPSQHQGSYSAQPEIKELIGRLCEIFSNKTQYPGLQKVCVWQRDLDVKEKKIYSWLANEVMPEIRKIEERVPISFFLSTRPPLFGSRERLTNVKNGEELWFRD